MRVREIEAGPPKNNGMLISAGIAQDVAYHTQRRVAATIVMPKGKPFTKIVRTQGFGTRVVLEGDPSAIPNPMPTKSQTKKDFFRPYDERTSSPDKNHRGNAGYVSELGGSTPSAAASLRHRRSGKGQIRASNHWRRRVPIHVSRVTARHRPREARPPP